MSESEGGSGVRQWGQAAERVVRPKTENGLKLGQGDKGKKKGPKR